MKKIALIVDTVNWAFYNNANNIKKYLSEKYDVTIIPTSYLENSLFHLYLLLEDYDLIHFFWRYELYYDNNEALDWILKEDGLDKNRFLADKLNYDKITTGVYDHLFIDDNIEITKSIFSRVKNYTVSSSKLLEIYNNLDLKYKPTRVITDGVNLELFYPINLSPITNPKQMPTVNLVYIPLPTRQMRKGMSSTGVTKIMFSLTVFQVFPFMNSQLPPMSVIPLLHLTFLLTHIPFCL